MARIRVLHLVARMNVGGVAHHMSIVSGRLDPERFETLLAHGRLGPGEASLEHLAEGEGCQVHPIESLAPEIDPAADARALRDLVRLIRRYEPHIVETHTAKAGFLGRLAAVLSGRPRPAIVHWYHGHVLEGYFGSRKNALYRFLERRLATVSDRLVGVSQATVDDLVRLQVAAPSRFSVVPYGLELDRFAHADPAAIAAFREASGVRDGELLLGFVGRLVPIKRVDVLLRAFGELRAGGAPLRLSISGDGESRAELERLASDLGVADAVTFHGFVTDPAATAAADIAVLSSDNEGTPIALIEAGSAGVPAVSTAAGGVPDVVIPGTGLLAERGDAPGLAAAIRRLSEDPGERARMGERARAHVLARYSVERLLGDVEGLYEAVLAERRPSASRPSTETQVSDPALVE